ncbi:hypothetical protein J2T55_002074 [Methylohalomonas lacus]|uniref:Caspase family p20 domain-containing protein n=1 Tax=Methylohalomonas lacus TaxID=398773 RepID=A0AAE3HKK5_9GAMM|nr:C13 family peptidase [Methylohalomonas lacus]MCS3904041.1 hypothetical protein [Methylohalomonas lacus]
MRRRYLLWLSLSALLLGWLLVEQTAMVPEPDTATETPPEAAADSYAAYYAALEQDTELALYRQNQFLTRELSALQPGNPDAVELYFLGIAGDGSQEVFRREVETIRTQLDRDFATADRSLLLVNSRTTTTQLPLATSTSIETALKGLAAIMNPEQDILFLYLTSHGSEQHELVLHHDGFALPDLSATRLAGLLQSLPVKWKVIMISACYSGGFIAPLKNEHTMIMTAARADRQSFGCSDTATMTYFGRAYFQEALPLAHSFSDAFARARQHISNWEAEFEQQSLPQIHAPDAIRAQLDRWAESQGVFE